jgi:hypothetical protein
MELSPFEEPPVVQPLFEVDPNFILPLKLYVSLPRDLSLQVFPLRFCVHFS